jgi:hypothetical protein
MNLRSVGYSARHYCDECYSRVAKAIEPGGLSYRLLCSKCPLPNTEHLVSAAAALVNLNPGAEKVLKMNIREVYPSKWLKAADLAGKPAVLKVATATMETLKAPDGTQETKLVVRFANTSKALVVNKTNLHALGEALGDNTEAWVGQTIEAYPTRVSMGGKEVDAIRLRKPNGGSR